MSGFRNKFSIGGGLLLILIGLHTLALAEDKNDQGYFEEIEKSLQNTQVQKEASTAQTLTSPVVAGTAVLGQPMVSPQPISIAAAHPIIEEESQAAEDVYFNSSAPSDIYFEAFVDKATATIGEQIKYTIRVSAKEDIAITFPQAGDNLGGFVIKDFGMTSAKKSAEGRSKQEQWYLIDTYTVGPYVIPSQVIQAKYMDGSIKVLNSPEIFVEIKSVIDGSDTEEGLKDIKSPLEIPIDTKTLWLVIISVVVGIIGVSGISWILWWKMRRRAEDVPIPAAHESALNELIRIEGLELLSRGEVKEYYYLVSNCLRNYLENRFALRAPEQTTEEFFESITQSNSLEGHYINLLKDYMRHCDLVKYAKLEPNANQTSDLIVKTREFINETKLPELNQDNSRPEVNNAI